MMVSEIPIVPRRVISDPKLSKLARIAEDQCVYAEKHLGARAAAIYRHALEQLLQHNNPKFLEMLSHFKEIPVTITQFIDDPYFAGGLIKLWPKVREDVINANPDILAGEPPITEVALGGATGTGKTSTAHMTILYRGYFLNCLKNPQKAYGLSPSTRIVFVFQSLTRSITDRVIYRPFREQFLAMPYVKDNVRVNLNIESEVRLIDSNIEFIQTVASAEAIVSAAIFGGILDEVNFMDVIEGSKKSYGARGTGGTYDQAEIVHSKLTMRLKGRFLTRGPAAYCLCVLSSSKYVGDFLDRHMKSVKDNNITTSYCACHTQYDVKPEGTYSGNNFKFLVGNEEERSRVIKDFEKPGKDYPENCRVEYVPIEYLSEALRDPEGFMRDVIGVASASLSPFILYKNKIYEAVDAWYDGGYKPWCEEANIDLRKTDYHKIIEENLPMDRSTPRFIGVDLSDTGTFAALAICKPLVGVAMPMMNIDDYLENEEVENLEVLPRFAVEAVLTFKPWPDKPLDIASIRRWILHLIRRHRFKVSRVTYDTFHSAESIQVLLRSGIKADTLSVDADDEAYTYFRSALYSNRIAMCDNEILVKELSNLEHDKIKGKVDHNAKNTKDASDAVVRAIFACGNSRAGRMMSQSLVGSNSRRRSRDNINRRMGSSKRLIEKKR